MKIIDIARFATIIVGTCLPFLAALSEPPQVGTFVTIPEVIEGPEDMSQVAERGLFFVPENRAKRESRIIPVHFLRFKATEREPGRPPVFLLPGGPGSDWTFSEAEDFHAVERLRKTRDVVYVSQRGNPYAPNLVPNLYVPEAPRPVDEAGTAERDRQSHRESLLTALTMWSDKGVDLAGYDILNIVDDVFELRAALGYDQIALRACSFGSQWSLAYLKRWPTTVERALLTGVEPLDYAYDSPKWLWASMWRLAVAAENDPHLAPFIPREGLMSALTTVMTRLEAEPVRVRINAPSGDSHEITLGAYDLQRMLRVPFGEPDRRRYEDWPRFVLELYGGDYRYLAALVWQSRRGGDRNPMIGLLIDNSLGISERRDRELLGEPEARWLGEINASYRHTRDLTPTAVVDDDFRTNQPIDVPVLLVNGDLDWSTPLENAQELLPSLQHGRLVTVKGAGHCPLSKELAKLMPETAEKVYAFLDTDFEDGTGERFFETIPAEIDLPQFDFSRPVGSSLYEQWLMSNSR